MASHSKHARDSKSEEKQKEHHEKGISGKAGKLSGISKTRHKLRGLKLAATAAVLAAGIAASPEASAKTMSSLTGPTEFPVNKTQLQEPEGYMINLPDEFAAFPKGETPEVRSKSLEPQTKKYFLGTNDEGRAIFEITESSSYLRVLVGTSTVVFRQMGSEAFYLDFSAYGMQAPVPRMEKGKDGKIILHLIDASTKTDLTLSFLPTVSSAGAVKAKVYREGLKAGQSDLVSQNIAEIIRVGEEILEQEKPKTIEEAREIYSKMGAEMVNQLREEYASASPELAAELGRRGQAVITAVLLRLYLSDDDEALSELDRLRADPSLDKRKLESFAWKNGILEEFQKIWPQCSPSYEDE